MIYKDGQVVRNLTQKFDFSWNLIADYLFLIVGAIIQAVAMRLFLIPSLLVSGGISGAAQIINYYTGWSIGFMVLLGNIPLFIVGWRYLGGFRFAIRTIIAIFAFSFFTDFLILFMPQGGITHDLVLTAYMGGWFLVLDWGLSIVEKEPAAAVIFLE